MARRTPPRATDNVTTVAPIHKPGAHDEAGATAGAGLSNGTLSGAGGGAAAADGAGFVPRRRLLTATSWPFKQST